MLGKDYEELKKMDLEVFEKLRGTSVGYQIYHEYWIRLDKWNFTLEQELGYTIKIPQLAKILILFPDWWRSLN